MLVLRQLFHPNPVLKKMLQKKKLLPKDKQYSSYCPYYPESVLERLESIISIESIRCLPSLGNDNDREQSRIRRLKVGILPF